VDLPNLPGGASGNFMEQFLADLLRMMGSGMGQASAKVDMARAMAQGVASGGEPEPNVDPVDRLALEPLVQVAQLHVAEITGLAGAGASTLQVQAVRPGAWAWQTVDDWSFVLDAALPGPSSVVVPPSDEPGAGMAEFLSQAMATMGPVLAAMQLGSAVGHLARSTMGQYELPVPRPDGQRHRLLVVPGNADRFARDWSLPVEDVRLWVCLRDVTIHAVLGQPSVAERFRELLGNAARAGAGDAAGMVEQLQQIDPTDPSSLQQILADPEGLLAVEPSPQRQRAVDELGAATAALAGYVEHVLDRAASRLLGGRGALGEAWRRWQVERDGTDRAAEALLGLDLGPAQVDRGAAFVTGVIERAGDEALLRLWSSGAAIPTPAEIDAPGLWLARTSLPELDADG
jgi:putative hydrolase